MLRFRNERIESAVSELDAAYEQERDGRAKLAWQNGVKWAVFKLEDGASVSEVRRMATELGVDFFKG